MLTPAVGGADIEVARRRRGRLSGLGRVALDTPGRRTGALRVGAEPVLLRLGAEQVLVREVTLPIAAERELGGVLRYEMDRLTPFSPGDVFWDYTVRGRDRARGQVRVDLLLVPRAPVRALLERLGMLGLAATALEVETPDGARTIPLDRGDGSAGERARRATRALAVLCGALLVATAAYPFVRQSLALDEVESQIETLKPRVAEAEALRKRITGGAAGAGAVAAARVRSGDVLQALSIVTDVLPDDTWLTSFALRQHKLVLEGQSAAATRLIGALSSEPRIHDPAFSAPVVRSDLRTDVFAIQAEFGP